MCASNHCLMKKMKRFMACEVKGPRCPVTSCRYQNTSLYPQTVLLPCVHTWSCCFILLGCRCRCQCAGWQGLGCAQTRHAANNVNNLLGIRRKILNLSVLKLVKKLSTRQTCIFALSFRVALSRAAWHCQPKKHG